MSLALANPPSYLRDSEGILRPVEPVQHRDEEYDPAAFASLLKMQQNHFWYGGRHRFLFSALVRHLSKDAEDSISAIDIGGGCGGWIKYLQSHGDLRFRELALADSSDVALRYAESVVGPDVERYQVDLLNLHWQDRWDAIFLLDVLEHIPEDRDALRQIAAALRPGGFLFVTTPALMCFWSYNDELAHHVRRYARADFRRLASEAGLELYTARYFMFFLSPLLVMSRWRRPDIGNMTDEEIRQHLQQTHRIPAKPINRVLEAIFSMETPIGHYLPFPWGTSILGVFRKPIC